MGVGSRRAIVSAAVAAGLVMTPVAAGSAATRPTAHPAVLSEGSLLTMLTHPSAQLSALPVGTTVSQVSSHDLAGGNLDGGSYNAQLAAVLPPTYVSSDASGFVLAHEYGPGCLVRIWMTSSSNGQGNTASFGNLQLFFDGATRPAVDVPVASFFAGQDRRFPRPLVNDYRHSSGGNYSYIPFCFAHSLVVRTTGKLATMANFFQLSFLNARSGTPVQTFSGGTAIARAAARAMRVPGETPPSKPASISRAAVRPGHVATLPALRGAGTIRYLQMSIRPFDISTLNALALRVAVDGAAKPQIDVPLAAAFGDGLETRRIRSSAFGEDPQAHTGYLALPIPYRDGARVTVASTGATAAVRLAAWTGPVAHTSDRLFGQRVITHAQLGTDYPVLKAGGSGRLATYVLDLEDATPLSGAPAGQWFMEGDERVYVDGLRSPSIYGTGTEDTFNGGYYFNRGAFTLPLNGAGRFSSSGGIESGKQSMYRVYADDGPTWADGIDYRQQAGGNDERLAETVAATTFSYRAPRALFPADEVALNSAASRRSHDLSGLFTASTLDSYFEGDRDGTIPLSTTVIGGSYYLAPPPEASPDGVSADGIASHGPVSVTFEVPGANRGVVLRRLQDQNTAQPVRVLVRGRVAGIWAGAQFQGNPLKRWLESDFQLPTRLTAGHAHLRVTLRPAKPGQTVTAYSLQAMIYR